MIYIIVLITAIAFFSTLFAITRFIKFLESSNIVGIDQQKKSRPLLPSSGGLPVAFGLLAGIMAYIALNTFVFDGTLNLTVMLAASSTILIISLVGILDDLNISSSSTFFPKLKCNPISLKRNSAVFLTSSDIIDILREGATTLISSPGDSFGG